MNTAIINHVSLEITELFFFFLKFFGAAPVAYAHSQARGLIRAEFGLATYTTATTMPNSS